MSLRINYLVFILCLVYGSLLSQTSNCTLNNALNFDASQLTLQNVSGIERDIVSKNIQFNEVQIAELNLQIKRCNNDIDNTVAVLKSQLQTLSGTRQDYLKISDIQGILKQIEEKKKSLNTIQEQILRDLEGISIKSVYLAFIPGINSYTDSKENCEKRTDELMASRVISATAPTFLKSITEIRNSQLNTDFITSKVSGAMTLERRIVSSINARGGHFVSLSKFAVSPLKKDAIKGNKEPQAESGFYMTNPLLDDNFEMALKSRGVEVSLLTSIQSEIESIKSTINAENQQALNRENLILQKGKENIEQITEEIELLEKSITNRDKRIRSYFEANPILKFDAQNMDANLSNVLSDLNQKMEALRATMRQEKEKELIAQMDISVPFEKAAAKDISNKAIDVFNILKSAYSRVEKFYDESEITDGKLQRNERGFAQDLYRVPERVWLYPVAMTDNSFKLSVVLKFKVSDHTDDHVEKDKEDIIEKKKESEDKKVEEFERSQNKQGTWTFYTDRRDIGNFEIYVNDKYVGTLNRYFYDKNYIPYCNERSTVSVSLPDGWYNWHGYNANGLTGSGEIRFINNHCDRMRIR